MSNTYIFWCFAEGRAPFSVECSNIFIEKLKEVIREELDIPSNTYLTLWKPLRDIPVRPTESLDERIGNLGLNFSQFARRLGEPDELSVHYKPATTSESPEPQIRIIVELLSPSALGKRSRVVDDPMPKELPWLTEVHKKIWNQEILRPKLFRRVEVTQADYTALQELLKKSHDEPDYNGSKPDVLSVKLKFLQSLNQVVETSPAQHADGDDSEARKEAADSKTRNEIADSEPEPSSEDDIVLQSLFPYILDFLDLSILGLKVAVTDRLPLPILLRQEYKHISDLINKEPDGSRGSVLVSGQPGQGKTAYLYLQIIENMIEGRPFLFQAKGGTVYHVTEKGVEVAQPSWSPDKKIVALVDGDKKNFEPDDILIHRSVQLIVASFPKVTSEKWIKQAGDTTTELAIKLWSQKELLLTGIFLNESDLPFKLLRESTSYFGYNPRQCFGASSSLRSLKAKVDRTTSVIKEAAMRNDFVQLFRSTKSGTNVVSDRIFQISPTDTDRLLSDCKFEAVSRWALDLLLHEYEKGKSDAAVDLYYSISRMPDAAPIRSHLFERQVLNHLCGIRNKRTFPIRGLTDSNQMEWTCHGPIRRVTFEESTVCNELTDAVRKREPVHLVPSARDFTAVDSIIYDPQDQDAALTCIQVTMNRKHPIAVKGLQKIQLWLESGTPGPLENLRPSKNRPWRFVFLVPSHKAPKYKLQKLNDDTTTGEWTGKVHQYVSGLKEETIFGARSDSIVQHATSSPQQGKPHWQIMEVE